MKKKAFICVLVFIVFGLIFPYISKAEYLDTLWKLNLNVYNPSICQFTSDGNYVIASRENKLYKYDVLNGNLVSTFVDSCDSIIIDMYVSKNLTKLVTCDFKQQYIYLWDYSQGTIINRISLPNKYEFFDKAVITNDDKYVIIVGTNDKGKNVLFYDIQLDSIVKSIEIPYTLTSLALSLDGQYLATGEFHYDRYANTYTSFLSLYSLDSLALITTFGTMYWVIQSLRYSPDGKYLTCGRNAMQPLTIWDMDSLAMIKDIDIKEDSTWTYRIGAFTKNNEFLVLGWPGIYSTSIIYDFIHDSVFTRLPIGSNIVDVYTDSNYILLYADGIYVLRLNPGTNPVTDRESSGSEKSLIIDYNHDKISMRFRLSEPEALEVSIYDFNGVLVKTFSTGWLEAGQHSLIQPLKLASGVYFARFNNGSRTVSRKFEVVR